jgi:lysophospholipase L1-like esterase
MLATSFYLHPGDRVVWYGDSITEQRHYTSFVESYVATRYPGIDVTFFNRGWSGDATWGGGGGTSIQRIDKDVAPLKPDVIFMMLGMNDGGYVPFDPKIDASFREWYGKDLDEFNKTCPGARYTLARTCPWDDYAHTYQFKGKPPEPWQPWQGYNDALKQYGLVVKDEATQRGALYVDFNDPLSDVLTRAAAQDPDTAREIVPDAIHPAPAGALIMAAELIKAWGGEPLVSAVTIDGGTRSIVESDRTKVTMIKSPDGSLSWKQLDESLPLALDPNDKALHLTADLSNFSQTLNRESLKVTNLPAGVYDLSIEKIKVGTFTADQLAAGVELSTLDTPMHRHSQTITNLINKRDEIQFYAWRNIQRDAFGEKNTEHAFDALQNLAEDYRGKIRTLAKPFSCTYILSKK